MDVNARCLVNVTVKTLSGTGPDGGGTAVSCCGSITDAPISVDEAGELAHLLAAMADPIRLRLLSIVAAAGEVCSCDLEAPLGRSQPTISHHTKVLADAGLIVGDKRGRWTWWRVDPGRLEMLRSALGGS